MRLGAGVVLVAAGCSSGAAETPRPPAPDAGPAPSSVPTFSVPPADTTGLSPQPFMFRDIDDADPGKRYFAVATLGWFAGEVTATLEGPDDGTLIAENGRLRPDGVLLVSPGRLRVEMAASSAALRLKSIKVHVDTLTSTWSIRTRSGALDVSASNACVNGYCQASDNADCTAAPPLAELLCLSKGFEGSTSFTTTTKTGAEQQCRAGGAGCTPLTPCGLVFSTIVCR